MLDDFTDLRVLVTRKLRSHGLDEPVFAAYVIKKWDELKNNQQKLKKILKFSRAAKFKNGAIYVEVDNSQVSQEIKMREKEILKLLNKLIGEDVINLIRLRVGKNE